ncbi:hypothetical protein [Fodinibius halophilus]|uniref:Uncharacterized protein n=1 Tax=Fodinibius halophilus TaxID=1736908 RepID=A0A6M1T551_9BACT|nr:hypothetical protein [Fodinibius halophilus]NGP87071.1 hypothetical protein [Fodinibius halophilus]
MSSLADDLKTQKNDLNEFYSLCVRVLNYLPAVISSEVEIRGYKIKTHISGGTKKFLRPINEELFIYDPDIFEKKYDLFLQILDRVKSNEKIKEDNYKIVDTVLYTIQQSLGAGFDLLVNPNSARKHVGNRFEELLKAVINYLEITNKDLVFKIPYETDGGKKTYRCQTDLIISPYEQVHSTAKNLDENEVILSFKTSSKDRMGKIFLDKLLMESFSNQTVKVVGIFLNDVQRKKEDNISYTFVSGLFMVYTNFLIKLDGVYFIDKPPTAQNYPYDEHIFQFSKFLIEDIWKLLK